MNGNLIQLIKSYRSLLVLAFLFGALTVGMNLGLMSTSSYLIAKAAQHPATILLLWTAIVAVRFFGTARAGFRYLDRYFAHDATLRWLRDLKTRIFAAIEPKTSDELKAYSSGDLLSRVGSDVDSLQNLLVGLYEPIIIAVVGLFMVFIIGALMNWHIALLLVLMLLIAGLVLSHAASRMARLSSRMLVDLRSALGSVLIQVLHGMTDIWALALTDKARADVGALQTQLTAAKHRLARTSGLFSGLALFTSLAGMWIVLVVAASAVTHHAMRPIVLPVFALLALASFEIVSGLPAAFQDASGLARAQSRVNTLIAPSSAASSPGRVDRLSTVPRLSFENVTVTLGTEGKPVLRHIHWTLEPGVHTALIGPNGSGKSTLMNLTAGLLSAPSEGALTLDRTDFREWDRDAWASHFGVVNQFPYVFHATLLDNVRLARPSASPEEVSQALHMAGMGSVLAALPDGLDTVLGERGASLSGGEIKRLAMARVFLKNAPIVLLDEPTEGLDPVGERELMEAVMSWARERTVLWIAHSLTNLDLVDNAVILDAGGIVGRGTVEQMMTHPIAEAILRLAPLPS
ncbi:thiol reductant ABC exporter subunit CydC [Sulfobacillus harzensis]|uniref:Thiol reductant ABC exporter subunit CydC n=1 Tax=Sulfobacillus harzensis TaxID=2729629 RepID=A0A7Y0L0X8_9FIRM|nr:thiol reductant ABC exporter subunit CydC [Sulfobacillus harzensis]NMP21263.1 thiol reductant ABC exporter subunit CydC [Sulfobacillus harzensis]